MSRPEQAAPDASELGLQRVALAGLLYVQYAGVRRYSGQPFPVGIAQYIDFSFLNTPHVAAWLEAGMVAALVLYALGRAMPIATAYLAAIWTAVGALTNSQGAMAHHTQLLVMVLLGQAVAYAVEAARHRGELAGAASLAAHARALDYSRQIMAAGYLLAGLMKIVLSRGAWIADVPMIASDIAKTHGQAYASTGVATYLKRGDAIAAFTLVHPHVMRCLLGSGLLLELAAPAALLGRRAACAIGLGLLAMHQGIAFLTLIHFPENEALLLIYFVNVPFLLVTATRHLGARARSRLPASRAAGRL